MYLLYMHPHGNILRYGNTSIDVECNLKIVFCISLRTNLFRIFLKVTILVFKSVGISTVHIWASFDDRGLQKGSICQKLKVPLC